MSNRMEGSEGPGVRANGPIAPPSSPVGSGIGPPLPPEEMGDEPQSSLTDVTQMWINFGKTFAIIFPIYILGYFEFSFSWVLIGLAALFYWRKNYGGRDYRINRALAFLEHEEKAVRQSVPTAELPPWVHYPDVERVEWLNKTVKQMWPFICQFVDKLFRETIEPAVKGANPHLSSFCFTKIDMGDKPLRVNGVKVYTENVDKRQVIMDLQISFVGNTEIDVDIKKYYCRAGIKSIQLHGTMRVVMEPLLGDMPLIGALSVFFLKKPLLDINWTGLTNMLDIPGVNGLCDNIIQDIIYSFLVLPNRLTIPLVGEAQLAQLRFPMPKGILRIHFIEAQDLLGKDKFLGGLIKGKSDPYGVIQVGTQLFQSKVVHETVHPKWNEVYEALIYDHTGQNLEIELFDEDTDKDDFLGRMRWIFCLFADDTVPYTRFYSFEYLQLRVFVVLSLCFSSFSLLFVCVLLQIRYKTNEPVWEEAFTFLIHNPKTQELEVEVKDDKHECTLGTLTLPLSRLLEAEDMTLNQRFPMKNSGPSCTLKMKMALRVGGRPARWWGEKKSPFSSSTPRPSVSSDSSKPPSSSQDIPRSASVSAQDLLNRRKESDDPFRSPGSMDLGQGGGGGGGGGHSLAETGRSTSNLAISGSQQYLAGGKEPTPSIRMNPYFHFLALCSGSGPSHFPLGEIQLTVRHSSQRNKLIVVVHACRNLIAFTDHGSDPYVRLYLLPDKRRSGRRKTHTFKKNLNPVYDQTFEFTVSLVELHRRTLDVAVKNGGGLLSKHKGLLGKVLVDLTHEDISKGWTQW
uniref:Extended synaptotagmin 2 n=1 Tax=Sparus aurata TaxID=8175 RepID=A0A671Z288_SPAAU